jgi:leader peptidase (prepilin peptidase)/N-methyltransferase
VIANVSTAQAITDPSVEAGVAPPYNLVLPRSRCPSCEQLIGALDNIPVLSYLVLGGKCRHCRTPISIRYPLVEILTALLCTVAVFRFGLTWAGAGAVLLTCALIPLAFIDLDRMLLPDNITLPFLWLGLALNTGPVFASLHDAVIGAIAGYGILWLVYHAFRLLTGKEGMGYGDFKLTGMLGAWLGWQALPGIILLSSLVGAIVGVALILLAGRARDKPIPFGPFLAAAGWIYLIWGPAIEYAYTHALGLR